MPSILNLKFKGNKSFVAFSNLSDVDSLTSTWKVCTKVASYLEQGQRLENLSWRLWHLQNLMVDTDNAKSKREFKKLSKNMSDKLDKEKGRSIVELEAPDFKRNHSSDIIRQRAVEKERSREASQNARPGTIKRMQFTFSVDHPATPAIAQTVKKPDLKPSSEFNKRGRTGGPVPADDHMSVDTGRKEDVSLRFPPLFSNDFGPTALLYPSPTLTTHMNYGEGLNAPNSNDSDGFSIPRPTIELPLDELLNGVDSPRPWSPAFFNSSSAKNNNNSTGDDNKSASTPLYSTTALNSSPNNTNNNSNESPVFYLPNTNNNHNEDVVMQSVPITTVSGNSFGQFGSFDTSDADDSSADVESDDDSSESVELMSTTTLSSVPPITEPAKVTTTTKSGSIKLQKVKSTAGKASAATGPSSSTSTSSLGRSTTPRPNLTVRTSSSGNVSTRSSIPSATVTSLNNTPSSTSFKTSGRGGGAASLNNNSAPGGQKAECSNCGATHTPLWRRGLNDELNCNACGLYCKLHKRPRPKTMRNAHGEGRSQSSAPRPETVEVMAQCYNCHTTATPLWRKDDEGKTVCNACGLYYKLHGSARPISMKSDVIRKRSRHDARRGSGGGGAGGLEETPSASPGVSRRTSPSPESSSPTLAPDSSTAAPKTAQQVYDYNSSADDMDFTVSKSELMNALGTSSDNNGANGGNGSDSSSSSSSNHENANNANNNSTNLYNFNFQFPGPYHPDHLMQYSFTPLDALPFPSGDYESDLSLSLSSPRMKKRRRMSSDSGEEPPSSVVSFSSFADSGYGGGTTSPATSTTSHSQRSSISALASEFPFSNAFNNNNNMKGSSGNGNGNNGNGNGSHNGMFSSSFRGSAANTFWHPPMMLQDTNTSTTSSNSNHHNNDSSSHSHSHSFLGLHPPMLPPSEDSPMDYLHPPMMMHHDDDVLFSTFLHPPMSLPSDESSSGGSGNSNSSGGNGNGAGSGSHGGNHYYVSQEYGLDMRIY